MKQRSENSYPPCAFHPRGNHNIGLTKGGENRYCTLCGLVFRRGNIPGRYNTRGGDLWRRRIAVCIERDGMKCFYCEGEAVIRTSYGPHQEIDAVLDHFIPKSRGGSDKVSNRRISCRKCDILKGDKLPWEFMPEKFSETENNMGLVDG